MKRILLVIIFLNTIIFANEIKTTKTYKEALSIAQNENKMVIFMTSILGCPVCDYMKDIVFKREKVVNYLSDNYTLVIRDIEKQNYPSKFFTTNAPTFYFIDPDGEKELRKPLIGGLRPEAFLRIIKQAVEDTNTTDINTTKG